MSALPSQSSPAPSLRLVLSTMATVFLAEVGDKTQLATLTIAAGSDAPLAVFLGSALALVLTSWLGVVAGQWLSARFPQRTVDTLAGISFLVLSVGLLWEAVV